MKKTTEMASPWLLRGGDGGRKERENTQSHLEESRAERERRLDMIRAVCKRWENMRMVRGSKGRGPCW